MPSHSPTFLTLIEDICCVSQEKSPRIKVYHQSSGWWQSMQWQKSYMRFSDFLSCALLQLTRWDGSNSLPR
jgi:hypothetical protein